MRLAKAVNGGAPSDRGRSKLKGARTALQADQMSAALHFRTSGRKISSTISRITSSDNVPNVMSTS
jgi:hypothetical protein